ncbi:MULTISPECIES: transposase DNA-binding-containing protein [unclassified Paraburkholderia]|uniref:transposase DNA-binding-containing protein n=1 Tax=unclassified Paraburkholderia TaxID=2615204 RepID=UPI0038BE0CFE
MIPFACQDWASTNAAYRFPSTDRVSEHAILRGHCNATTRLRCLAEAVRGCRYSGIL